MPPRAMWTGQLRLSLVSFGVRMYAATESGRRVSMNQLHRDCHQRLRNQTTCPVHGPVGRDEIVKGYEYEKDSYVIIEPSDLEAIRLPSTKTIDLVQFVEPDEIEPLYINTPYYLGPDGPVAEEPFRVIREAMKRSNVAGVGKLALHGRENLVAIRVYQRGFLMTTLRYASEVRSAEQYFADVRNGEVDKEQVELAESIIGGKTSEFDPAVFEDRYREAFFEVVKQKIEGEEPVVVEDEEGAERAYNFMEALKQSVAEAEEAGTAGRRKKTKKKKKKAAAKKPPAKSVGRRKKQKKTG